MFTGNYRHCVTGRKIGALIENKVRFQHFSLLSGPMKDVKYIDTVTLYKI